MNNTKIEWCDYTWNPVTGCKHGCGYCYARRFAARGLGRYELTGFMPTFHLDRLSEPEKVKKSSRVFVGSMSDLLGTWDWMWMEDNDGCYGGTGAPSGLEICEQVSYAMEAAPQHSYIILTKSHLSGNTAKCARLLADAGAWIGVSVTGAQKDFERERERIRALMDLGIERTFVSYEPMLGDHIAQEIVDAMTGGLSWLIMGSLTGPVRVKEMLRHDELTTTINLDMHAHENGCAVFVKDSLAKEFNKPSREYPAGMVGGTKATP